MEINVLLTLDSALSDAFSPAIGFAVAPQFFNAVDKGCVTLLVLPLNNRFQFVHLFFCCFFLFKFIYLFLPFVHAISFGREMNYSLFALALQ